MAPPDPTDHDDAAATTASDAPRKRGDGIGAALRRRAIRALVRVERDGAPSQAALTEVLGALSRSQGPGETGREIAQQDRALVTEIVYGVLRAQVTLDAEIATACSKGLYKMQPEALAALRVGLYQLRRLARVPVHAAVAATVEATKGLVHPRVTQFVNAVLRRLARGAPPEVPQGDTREAMSLRTGRPPWILARLEEEAARIGVRTETLAEAFGTPSPLALRVTMGEDDRPAVLAALAAEGVWVVPEGLPDAMTVRSGDAIGATPFREGRLLPQDLASVAVGHLVAPRPGERVLDLASGRGVKASHLLALSGFGARLACVDLSRSRLADSRDLIARLGQRAGHPIDVSHVEADATRPLPFEPAWADAVLLDAPCSGLGTLRRRPEIQHQRGEADIVRLAAMQRKMLDRAAEVLRPGGRLVYAVCSLTFEEGEAQISDFLRRHGEFARTTAQAPAFLSSYLDGVGDLRTDPLRHNTDAFYAARLERRT